MSRHLACVTAHSITVRATTEASRPDICPAEATHYSRQPHGIAWAAFHGYFKLIKHLVSGDALDAVGRDLPFECAQHRLPGIFVRSFASCFRPISQRL